MENHYSSTNPNGFKLSTPVLMAVFLVLLSIFVLQAMVGFVNKNSPGSRAAQEQTAQQRLNELMAQKGGLPAGVTDKEVRVLQKEAATLGITVTDQEIADKAGTDVNQLTAETKSSLMYDLLSQKVEAKRVKSKSVYMVGVWLPNTTKTQGIAADKLAQVEQMRSDMQAAAPEIQSMLQAGQDGYTIAQTIAAKYPSLAGRLNVNQYGLQDTSDKSVLKQPRVYALSELDNTNPIDQAIASMNTGDVRIVSDYDGAGSGAVVVKVVNSNTTGADSYDQFINNSN